MQSPSTLRGDGKPFTVALFLGGLLCVALFIVGWMWLLDIQTFAENTAVK